MRLTMKHYPTPADRWPACDPDMTPVLPPIPAEYSRNIVKIIGRSKSDADHLYIEYDDGHAALVVRSTVRAFVDTLPMEGGDTQ